MTGSSELARLEREHGWRASDHASLDDGVWLTPAAGAEVDFPDDALAVLSDVEDRSMWFTERNALIAEALDALGSSRPPALWDVGAGNGVVSRHLQSRGIAAVAVEPSRTGAREAARRGVRDVVCGTFESLRLPNASLPAVGMFDVLEHLPEPLAVLAEVRRVLAPGGILVLNVPASPRLWSQADEVAGHHVRYDVASLDRVLADGGFAPVRRGHRFASATLPLYLARVRPYRRGVRLREDELVEALRTELGPRSSTVEAVGRALLAVERRLARRVDLPFGTSILGVYRRSA